MHRRRRAFAFASICFGFASCDHKVDPPSGMPPLAGAAPTVGVGPEAGHPPTGANLPSSGEPGVLPAGHPALPFGYPAMGAPAGDPPIVGETPGGDFDPKATIGGALVLADAIKDKVSAGEVIFLVARQDDGSDKGSILGVKRLTVGAWPQPFQLDGRDAMQPGTKLSGKVLLTARVDKDGDAISKNPGDALGVAHVTVPAMGVKVVIDTITK
jgi:hypothetical protein